MSFYLEDAIETAVAMTTGREWLRICMAQHVHGYMKECLGRAWPHARAALSTRAHGCIIRKRQCQQKSQAKTCIAVRIASTESNMARALYHKLYATYIQN